MSADTCELTREPDIDVSVVSFNELFVDAQHPLKLDTYQRGFVWGADKIERLLADLHSHESRSTDPTAYFMGTVVLHEDAQQDSPGKAPGLYVIDGQQRLTALCVLHHRLLGRLPPKCDLFYSETSARRIRRAAMAIGASEQSPSADIFSRVLFTVIRVSSADLAFTFFDTQNNRGVPLHASDLLKAFHLRAFHGAASAPDTLQRHCASRWETIQQGHPVLSRDNQLTHSLFQTFLWRARRWTGQQTDFAAHDDLLDEFQHHTLDHHHNQDGGIALYRSRHNRLASRLTLSPAGHAVLSGASIALNANASSLPFVIRQPIQRGPGFFLYAEKYAALLQWLMHETPCSLQREQFRKIDEYLLRANSLYLREVFVVCALIYVDQFEDERLAAFGLWLEHALGCIRLTKAQVRYQRAQKFISQSENEARSNVLDHIANAFTPEQVIDRLKKDATAFDSGKIASDISEGGVQGVYRRAVLRYFRKPCGTSLANKTKWIADKISAP